MSVEAGTSNMVPDDLAPELTAEQASQLHCVVCGNDDAYELREVEESVTVAGNTALVRIHAAVCRFCGERVYDLPNRARLEQVRQQLGSGEVADFEPVGVTYRVP
jgi:YgiT-type zinc finger domain-containing protein